MPCLNVKHVFNRRNQSNIQYYVSKRGPASSIKQQRVCEMNIHTYSLYRTHPQPFNPRLRKKKKFKNKKEFVPEIKVYSRKKVWLHDTVWLESDEKMRNRFNEAGAWQGDELCRGKQLRVSKRNQLLLLKDETLRY